MTTPTIPWTLRFERDGTEDIAVLTDESGDLFTSRHFWLPEGGDPMPSTLEAVTLAVAAPDLLAALRLCHEQLSLWTGDVETCDLSPEDEVALEKATIAIAKATVLHSNTAT